MKIGLLGKLTGSFALVVMGFSVVLALVFQASTAASFVRLVNQNDETRAQGLRTVLEQWYADGGWDEVRLRVLAMTSMTMPRTLGSMNGMMSHMRSPGDSLPMHLWGGDRIVVTDAQARVVVDSEGQLAGTTLPAPSFSRAVPFGSGADVGRVLVGSMIVPQISPGERAFLDSMNRALLFTTLLGTVVAVATGFLLFRGIMRPLRRLEAATRSLGRGDFGAQVPILSHDELGQISEQFNAMVAALSESRDRQRQFIADAAHELRTPVSLLQSTLEMMVDGLYPADPERLVLLHQETVRLGRLVSDLQELSWSDSGQLSLEREPVNLHRLIGDATAPFGPALVRQGVVLRVDVPDAVVLVDAFRMTRVFTNLVANAIRFAPPGSFLDITAAVNGTRVECRVKDEGPGIVPADVERIFDRFYRTDASRSRDRGGSGLGLAICRTLVEAHGGTIRAELPPHGASFLVVLPTEGRPPQVV